MDAADALAVARSEAVATRERQPIIDGIDYVDDRLLRIDSLLVDLVNKLEPILTPVPPSDPHSGDIPQGIHQIDTSLTRTGATADSLGNRLAELLSRIEI